MRRSVIRSCWPARAPTSASAQSAASLAAATKAFVSVDAPVIVLTMYRWCDGTGAAPALDQTVVIDNGKITAVGSFAFG